MVLIDPEEAARRVRAALAYADIDVKASPAATGISYATMQRIVSPTSPRGATIEQLWAIADACDVPRRFMEHGFTSSDVPEDIESQLSEIRDVLVAQAAADEQLRRQLADLRDEGRRTGPGAAGP